MQEHAYIGLKRIHLEDLPSLGVEVFRHSETLELGGTTNLMFQTKIGSAGCKGLSIKRSESVAGVGRGLHHQRSSKAQDRFVTITQGQIVDVIFNTEFDGSPLYFFNFSSEDRLSIFLPKRFAHGFISLSDVTFEFCSVGLYIEENENTLNVLPGVARALGLGSIIMSEKDASFSPIPVKSI